MKFRQVKDTGEEKPTRYFSNKQEQSVAETIGGRKVANSGATAYHKGDVVLDEENTSFLIECKTKTKDSKSISIQKDWLKKLKDESLYMKKKYEALIFDFGPNSKQYAIIDLSLFNILVELLNKYDE